MTEQGMINPNARVAPEGAKLPKSRTRVSDMLADLEIVMRTIDVNQPDLSNRDLMKAAAKTFDAMLNSWERVDARKA